MGVTPAFPAVDVDEYLSNPAYQHFEYVDGRPVEMQVGTGPHSFIQVNCVFFLQRFLRQGAISGRVFAEFRCRLNVRGHVRFYQPDISVVLGRDVSRVNFLDGAPDVVVEIRSPGETISSQLRKLDDFLANGARLAWLIVPEEESVIALTPSPGVTRTYFRGETLDGFDVLPGFSVSVDELFS